MPVIVHNIAASTAAGTDVLKDSLHRVAGNDREVVSVGMSSAGVANSVVRAELYVGDINVGTIPVVSTGTANYAALAPPGDAMYPLEVFVPAGSEMRAILSQATVGVGVIAIEIDDVDDDDDDYDDEDDDEMAPEFV